ncbi:MAG: hypothetical protein HYZ49_17595 [Chloroflexi bacterium]|nr:hypothetical protein [Chloroflexota bacterium]
MLKIRKFIPIACWFIGVWAFQTQLLGYSRKATMLANRCSQTAMPCIAEFAVGWHDITDTLFSDEYPQFFFNVFEIAPVTFRSMGIGSLKTKLLGYSRKAAVLANCTNQIYTP